MYSLGMKKGHVFLVIGGRSWFRVWRRFMAGRLAVMGIGCLYSFQSAGRRRRFTDSVDVLDDLG